MEIIFFESNKILKLGRAFTILSLIEDENTIKANRILVFFVELKGERSILCDIDQATYSKEGASATSQITYDTLRQRELESFDGMIYRTLSEEYQNYLTDDFNVDFKELDRDNRIKYLKKSKNNLTSVCQNTRRINIAKTIRLAYLRELKIQLKTSN